MWVVHKVHNHGCQKTKKPIPKYNHGSQNIQNFALNKCSPDVETRGCLFWVRPWMLILGMPPHL
jgi:hypothetical protein